MNVKALALAVGLAVGSIGMVGVAKAVPMLQIVSNAAGDPVNPGNAEAIGDAGGTLYTNGPTAGASNGPGMPTGEGGWPSSATWATDTFDPPQGPGITGYDGSYLWLTETSKVTFQFMGKGDATDHNQFWVYTGGAWNMLWDNKSGSNGTCGMIGTSPSCPDSGSQFSSIFSAGLIPFYFVNLSNPATAINNGGPCDPADPSMVCNPKDYAPGFFLGVDPYLASGQYDTMGKAVYAGFTDRPPPGDHDYEDLIVRVSVPEPGSIFLLGAGLIGLAGLRRRKV